MPDQEPEEQSWPPSPAGQAPPSVATPTGLPRGLKIGLAAAATGIVFTLWHLVCLNPYRPPLLRSLPNMPADLVIVTFLGGVKVVVFSLPMLTVLVLAGAGLAIDLWGWPVGRRTTRHGGFWMTALGFALNLLPFVLFARFFVTDITASVME